MIVVKVREVIRRIIEIDVIVVMALQEVANVIAPTHRDHTTKQIRMLEILICRQVRA